jgi:hypothetical protein
MLAAAQVARNAVPDATIGEVEATARAFGPDALIREAQLVVPADAPAASLDRSEWLDNYFAEQRFEEVAALSAGFFLSAGLGAGDRVAADEEERPETRRKRR